MKLYVRDEQNKIIGFREILEENERINKIIELEDQARKYKLKQKISLNEKDKNIRNMLFRFYGHKYVETMLEIDRLYKTPTYRYEDQFDFNVTPEKLEYFSFVSNKKKEKRKILNNTLKLKRNWTKKSDTKMITLDPEFYK